MEQDMKKIWGIDLGTTYSCISYVDEHGKPVVVKNLEGELTTPSVVFFDEGNNIVVGKAAKESARMYPEAVVSFVKRLMGDPNYLFGIEKDNSLTFESMLCVSRRSVASGGNQRGIQPFSRKPLSMTSLAVEYEASVVSQKHPEANRQAIAISEWRKFLLMPANA